MCGANGLLRRAFFATNFDKATIDYIYPDRRNRSPIYPLGILHGGLIVISLRLHRRFLPFRLVRARVASSRYNEFPAPDVRYRDKIRELFYRCRTIRFIADGVGVGGIRNN